MKYKVKKIKNRIYSVVVADDYDRAMLFLRAQEYYENPKFKGKIFDIWDFIKDYSKDKEGFTYAKDWTGFNLPFNKASYLYDNLHIYSFTKYDTIFNTILGRIDCEDSYIIGVDKLEGEIFNHELAHALYYTNQLYKEEVDQLTSRLKDYERYKGVLIGMGYDSKFVDDEIQANMIAGEFEDEGEDYLRVFNFFK
jgi:hypothetical protein